MSMRLVCGKRTTVNKGEILTFYHFLGEKLGLIFIQ